jgi:hypothetical protein
MSTRGKSRAGASATHRQKDRDLEPSIKEEGGSVYDDNSPPLSPLSSASSSLSDPPDERDPNGGDGTSETVKGKRKPEENGEGSSGAASSGRPRNGTSSTEVISCVPDIRYHKRLLIAPPRHSARYVIRLIAGCKCCSATAATAVSRHQSHRQHFG